MTKKKDSSRHSNTSSTPSNGSRRPPANSHRPQKEVAASRNALSGYESLTGPALALIWALYAVYCYAAFFPQGPVWGIHFMAYVPIGLKILLLLVGVLLLPRNQQRLYRWLEVNTADRWHERHSQIILAAIVAVIGFFLYRAFTIKTDIYGDNILMLKEYGSNGDFHWSWITDMWNTNLNVSKEALTVAVHRLIAHLFSISIGSAYTIVSEVCGGVFLLIWLLFVQNISEGGMRLVLVSLGIFAGAVQVFFGHVENYSFSILIFVLFLTALYWYFEKKVGTGALVLLFLMAFKAHIAGILFLPALLVAIACQYTEKFPRLQWLLNWRSLSRIVILPALLLGIASYVFVFHSWNEPYGLSSGRELEQSFLPIVHLPAPLDRYSLWAPYHIADFLNLLLLTAAPIVLILTILLLFYRNAIDWAQPRLMVFAIATLFPFLFFFAMNPLLTPERDWDVYTLFFPPALFFVAMLLREEKVRAYAPAWLGTILVFGTMFTTVQVAVNASPHESELRLQDIGAYAYRSFYAGSAYIEARSFVLDSSDYSPLHFSSVVSSLAPRQTDGNETQLADMMSRLASLYAFDNQGDSAIAWAERASRTDRRDGKYLMDLAACYTQYDHLDAAAAILSGLSSAPNERTNANLADIMSELATGYSRQGNDSAALVWATGAWRRDPLHLQYTFDLANYFMQSNRPRNALETLETVPPDSISTRTLTGTAIAAAATYGPDSAMPYLLRAKALDPRDTRVDSLLMEMKAP